MVLEFQHGWGEVKSRRSGVRPRHPVYPHSWALLEESPSCIYSSTLSRVGTLSTAGKPYFWKTVELSTLLIQEEPQVHLQREGKNPKTTVSWPLPPPQPNFWLVPLRETVLSLGKHSSAALSSSLTQEHGIPPADYLSSCLWCPEAAQ